MKFFSGIDFIIFDNIIYFLLYILKIQNKKQA